MKVAEVVYVYAINARRGGWADMAIGQVNFFLLAPSDAD